MTETSLHANNEGSKKNKTTKPQRKIIASMSPNIRQGAFSFSCFHGDMTIHRSWPDTLHSTQGPVISIIEKNQCGRGEGEQEGKK